MERKPLADERARLIHELWKAHEKSARSGRSGTPRTANIRPMGAIDLTDAELSTAATACLRCAD
jgi:hypothetical protein